MKYLLFLSILITGCTTVNVYTYNDDPVVIKVTPTVRDPNNPYKRNMEVR